MRVQATALAMAGLTTLALPATAQVSRFEVTGPPQVILDGHEFGSAGRYERITARAAIALDPIDARNAIIADIATAPKNAEGRVEAVADVTIVRPVDQNRANGTMLLEVPNRGRKLALPMFNESSTAADLGEAGNAFLMREGYTMVWVGWQADFTPAPGQLTIQVPSLPDVTGRMREELTFEHTRSPVTISLAYPATESADPQITVRERWDLPRKTPADLSFRFLDPLRVEVTRPVGFDAGAIYELTYNARNPMVLGIGFAAVRDVASFLQHARGPNNPLAQRLQRSIAFGVSQSGRFLRDFIYLGFNEDTAGRIVFDGIMPHVAGTRRMSMNTRFARPDKAPRSLQDPAWTADAFPFTYVETTNPYTRERDGLLRRCQSSRTCPKVMQTDTEYEWWGAHASLLVTDPDGLHLDLPTNVRAYMVTGVPHFAEPGATTRANPVCALPVNPNHAGAPMRALLKHLDAWVRSEAAPPASRVPERASGTLVDATRALPNTIPGLPYTGLYVTAAESDHSVMPPREIGRFQVFVPRADNDGMAIAGIRMPVIEAPRATYTAWNPRAEGYGPGVLCPLQGAVVPFAETRAARIAAGDPRPSLEERYPSSADYVQAVRTAASRLVRERMMLEEDASAMVAAAEADRLAR
jgi:hypothetical protein